MKNSPSSSPKDQVVSAKDLAGILGVTTRRITQRAAEGMPRAGDGFLLGEAIRWLLARAREPQTTLLDSRKRKADADAELKELELATRRGKLVDTDHVAQAWADHIARARALLLALPSRLAVTLAGEVDPAKIEAALTEHIHEALHELADEGEAAPARRKGKRT